MKTYIELNVHNDGDIYLTKMPEPARHKCVLTFDINGDKLRGGLRELRDEVLSYGANTEVVDRCIVEVLTGGYGEEIPVK